MARDHPTASAACCAVLPVASRFLGRGDLVLHLHRIRRTLAEALLWLRRPSRRNAPAHTRPGWRTIRVVAGRRFCRVHLSHETCQTLSVGVRPVPGSAKNSSRREAQEPDVSRTRIRPDDKWRCLDGVGGYLFQPGFGRSAFAAYAETMRFELAPLFTRRSGNILGSTAAVCCNQDAGLLSPQLSCPRRDQRPVVVRTLGYAAVSPIVLLGRRACEDDPGCLLVAAATRLF